MIYATTSPKPPEGFKIRRSTPTEVFVDLDSQDTADWHENRDIVEQLGGVRFRREGSKTPGHYHGIVTLSEPLGQVERLLIGVCLGGDKKRALLGLKNILAGKSENADVLFEEKK